MWAISVYNGGSKGWQSHDILQQIVPSVQRRHQWVCSPHRWASPFFPRGAILTSTCFFLQIKILRRHPVGCLAQLRYRRVDNERMWTFIKYSSRRAYENELLQMRVYIAMNKHDLGPPAKKEWWICISASRTEASSPAISSHRRWSISAKDAIAIKISFMTLRCYKTYISPPLTPQPLLVRVTSTHTPTPS